MRGMNAYLRGDGPQPGLDAMNAVESAVYDYLCANSGPQDVATLAQALDLPEQTVARAAAELVRADIADVHLDGPAAFQVV